MDNSPAFPRFSSCFWVQLRSRFIESMCWIYWVYIDKTRQESNLVFHADTHHIQMCSKYTHTYIYRPLRGPVPHPLVLPRFTSSKDAESRWKGRRRRERKDICFFPGPPVLRRQQVWITTKEWEWKSWKSVSQQVLVWHSNPKYCRARPWRLFCICKHERLQKSTVVKQWCWEEPESC